MKIVCDLEEEYGFRILHGSTTTTSPAGWSKLILSLHLTASGRYNDSSIMQGIFIGFPHDY
jgi:hypothetical protein